MKIEEPPAVNSSLTRTSEHELKQV